MTKPRKPRGDSPSAKPRFPPDALRALAGDAVFARGEAYHRAGQVELLADDGRRVQSRVIGTEVYRCELAIRGAAIEGQCTCPAFDDHGFCKHLVATGLAINGAAEPVPDRIGAIRSHLRGLGAERLAEMLLDLAERDAALLARLELAATAASGDTKQLGKRLRYALRRALGTGRRFIDHRAAGAWTRGVLDVLDQVEALLPAGQAALALELVDDLFARLEQALQSVDDSDGGGGEIRARAAAIHLAACRAVRPEPQALARELFARELHEGWGSFDGASEHYAELLGAEGAALYRALAQEAWDKRPHGPRRIGGLVVMGQADVQRHVVFRILDRFAERDGDVDRRVALRAADLTHAHDHLRLAQFCLAEGRETQALRVAEDGAWLHDDASGEPLQHFLAERYLATGRREDAIAVLWRAFERRPSAELFKAMAAMDAPGKAALADRAVALIEARLTTVKDDRNRERAGLAVVLAEILMSAQRLAAAWEVARKPGLNDHALRRLAEASETAMPDAALTAYAGLVERQIAQTSKQGYAEACRLVARMRALRARQGDTAEHDAFLAGLLQRHSAKRSLVAMLKETGAGRRR